MPRMSDSQHDFDFLFGDWTIRNRRLKDALADSSEWVEFDASGFCRPIWNGLAHYDEFDAPETPWGHIQGMTLRLLDPKSRQWTIYWANRNNGRLDPPMTGGFSDGVGEFYDQELFHGRMIYVRFIWSNISATTARWEQAFSENGGKSWETNWVMDFTRRAG
jgi:hypothetical protein